VPPIDVVNKAFGRLVAILPPAHSDNLSHLGVACATHHLAAYPLVIANH
jgi:hypothetical protein